MMIPKRTIYLMVLIAGLLIVTLRADDKPGAGEKAGQFVFHDAGAETGLLPDALGIRGHAAGWGDVDGDGWLDLYIGAFGNEGSKPNQFFRNVKGKFHLDDQAALRISARPTGAIFVDLDNDGDLDLYVSSMPKTDVKDAPALRGCSLFRNDGGGKFTDISKDNGACPDAFGGRSATVLDYDGDGLLDLLVGEDPLPGYNGSTTASSRLFHNKGNLQFEDVSRAVGLPAVPGYGVAAADVNNDGWADFFLAANRGGNLLFLNDGHGKFREAPGSKKTFAWENAVGDNMVCGVCFGDVNRDGLVDVVLGQHFKSPWSKPVANRLYMNRGIKDGVPSFEDVTESAGLVALPMKAPQVEIQDFDNDGWPDIYVSIVKFAAGEPHPVIFRNLGGRVGGSPHFREDALALNDFPTAQDKALVRAGPLFEKALREKKIIYSAGGPSGDFDNDGRLDLFLANWWIEAPSLLMRNQTPGGHWLDVTVQGSDGVNRMGIGSTVRIYPAGKLGDAASLIGGREIAVGFGYASGQAAIAHFGLGEVQNVDVEVVLPHNKGSLVQKDVKADQRILMKR
jgi:hypothetical protein